MTITENNPFWNALSGRNSALGKRTVGRILDTAPVDPDGNLLSDGRFTYTWDGENRLVSLQCNTGILPVNRIKVDFAYDYMGRRVSKKSYSWSSSTNNWQLSTDDRFVWDGWSLIATFSVTPTLRLTHTYLWGADGLLSDTDVAANKSYLAVYDGNLNIVAYVDASTGAKVAEYEYDAFGRIICKSGPKPDDIVFRFSSYQFDAETGFVYYGYRYYNPETGRWLNRDKITERGGLNLYGMGNDFVNYSDDLGLALYAFDGTGNNEDKLSGYTNIWYLSNAYTGKAYYMRGVGTGGYIDQKWGGITGAGGQTRLEDMYDALVKRYQWGDHTIDIIGFSRGAALARTFANLIKTKGIPTGGFHDAWAGNGTLYKEADKFQCVRIRFLGIFDTVASFGIPGNDTNIGYNLSIPDIVDHVAHATSRDEMRGTFPLSSIYSLHGKIDRKHRIEKSFPGVHSDVGGGYRDHPEAQYGPLKWMWQQGNEAASQSGQSPNPMFDTLPDSIESYLKSPSSNNPYLHDSRLDEKGKYQKEYMYDVYKRLGEREIYLMGDN